MNLVTKEKIQNQSSSHSMFVLMFQSSKQTVLQRDVFFQCFSFHPLTYIAIVSTSKALPIYLSKFKLFFVKLCLPHAKHA